MAAPHNTNVPQDTLITIKITVNEQLKKLKLPLKDLGANVLPDKLRHLLEIAPEQTVVFERFSDSAGGYITLDPNNPQVFKTLIRAAKAKLKLRLKATVSPLPQEAPAEMPEEKVVKTKAMEPVIVRSPVYQYGERAHSMAMDGKAFGAGIFEFREAREARASQQTLVDTSEAPVPRPFNTEHKSFFDNLAEQSKQSELAIRTREPAAPAVAVANHAWSVYCNSCDQAMSDAHFHCNICDGGDYDLCEKCVSEGKLCPGEGHWLIKRFIKEGQVISSTTERISPKQKAVEAEPEVKKEIPGAFNDDAKTLTEEPRVPSRTCNCCVVILAESEFVTCTTCDDYDLCISCHVADKHGHHPAHAFKPATDSTVLPLSAEMLLSPGRNVRHSAICDGCDKKILGVRYKCLNCPDWDYCHECHKNAQYIHPRHRFAPLYAPIPEPRGVTVRHLGIYCDGPLCSGKTTQYIEGVRFKCAVCHDTDFCASCEALPGNQHNRTHPLIKFKTSVRNVSITTENQDVQGSIRMMGDRYSAPAPVQTKTASTETTPLAQTNAATQVQTMAEIKPTEQKTLPIPIIKPEEKKPATPAPSAHAVPSTLLNAHFVQDSIADGTTFQPGSRFTQMWTIRNPGPYAWPAGCSVRFVGGDNMLNVDNTRPAAVSDINGASESNVIGREVQVGEHVAFKVTLKAPMRPGKHISYWRTKAADGTPFGHRLWCDIEVKKNDEVKVEPKVAAAPAQPSLFNPEIFRRGPPQLPSLSAIPPQATPQQRAQMMQSMIQAQKMRQAQFEAQRQAIMQQQHMAAARQTAANTAAPVTAKASSPAPPPYSASTDAANISARIAAMREQQAKRRELMMSQFNAQLEQTRTGAQASPPPAPQQPAAMSPPTPDEEKARKEAARLRVEHIKAKILRAREEKAQTAGVGKKIDAAEYAQLYREGKLPQTRPEQTLGAAGLKKSADVNAILYEKPLSTAADLEATNEKVKKIIEQVTKVDEDEKKSEDMEGSNMVFPKLEKESPASSTYQSATSSSGKGKAAYVENEQGEIERSASPSVASPVPATAVPEPVSDEEEFEELDDDIEVLSANGEESEEDDGFLTDEEYDILDASDNETVASK